MKVTLWLLSVDADRSDEPHTLVPFPQANNEAQAGDYADKWLCEDSQSWVWLDVKGGWRNEADGRFAWLHDLEVET